jgi:hypothetical protein
MMSDFEETEESTSLPWDLPSTDKAQAEQSKKEEAAAKFSVAAKYRKTELRKKQSSKQA